MLVQVPVAIAAASRQVTLRHPNAFDCVVSRKRVTRVEADADGDPAESAGLPTLGGMGVLRSEDEAEFEYDEMGAAKLLFAGPGPYQPMDMNDRDNALLTESTREVIIECVAKPNAAEGAPQFFVADTGDLVMINLTLGVYMGYEVAGLSGTINLPPHNRKLLLNPRDDLSYVEPFTD